MIERRLCGPLMAGEGRFDIVTSRPVTEGEWAMIVECLFLSKPGFVEGAESTSFANEFVRVGVLPPPQPAETGDAK